MSEQIQSSESVAEDIGSPPTVAVGEQLRQARETRGLELSDIAQALKLGVRQVEALECGDWEGLPGATFIRGFVRNYARCVQIDAAPLMSQLDILLEKPVNTLDLPEASPVTMPQPGARVSRHDRLVILVGGLLVVVAVIGYFAIPGDLSSWRQGIQGWLDSIGRKAEPVSVAVNPQTEPLFPPGSTPQQVMNPQAVPPSADQTAQPAAPGEQPGATPPAATVQPEPAPAATPEASSTTGAGQNEPPATTPAAAVGAPQMRAVFDKESWLEVRDRDNHVLFSQKVAAGNEQAMSGKEPLSLTIGLASGVRLFWRGKAVDLAPHTHGNVARLVLE